MVVYTPLNTPAPWLPRRSEQRFGLRPVRDSKAAFFGNQQKSLGSAKVGEIDLSSTG